MNYQKIYDNIIKKRKFVLIEGYTEKHHIIPKCLGGSNDPSNLVSLTAREHYLCHKILWKLNPNHKGLFFAYMMMAKLKTTKMKRSYMEKISSKEYNDLRIAYSKFISGDNNIMRKSKELREFHAKRMKESNPMYNPETVKRVSEKVSKLFTGKGNPFYGKGDMFKGEGNPFYGKTHTEETKEKIREKIKLAKIKNPDMYKKSDEHKKLVNEKNKTRNYIRKIKMFVENSSDKELAINILMKHFDVSKITVEERLEREPNKKEPTIEEMYLNTRKYKNHIRLWEKLNESNNCRK